MWTEEEAKAVKFGALRVTEEQFNRLTIDERIRLLSELKEKEHYKYEEVKDLYARAKDSLQRSEQSHSEFVEQEKKLRTTKITIEELTKEYKQAVREQRRVIGRIGAYTRWFRVAVVRHDLKRARHYSKGITEQRKKLIRRKVEVLKARTKLKPLPTIPKIKHELEFVEDKIKAVLKIITRKKRRLIEIEEVMVNKTSLMTEINKELDELRPPPAEILHNYKDVYFEIVKSIEYAARESGSDVDVEVIVEGTLTAMLPTLFKDKEEDWINEIEPKINVMMEKIIDECIDTQYVNFTDIIGAGDVGTGMIKCNVSDIRITRETIIDATERYAGLVPPITKDYIKHIFRTELEGIMNIQITSVLFMRSNTKGGRKSRSTYVEGLLRQCINKRSIDLLEEIATYTINAEIEPLMEQLRL